MLVHGPEDPLRSGLGRPAPLFCIPSKGAWAEIFEEYANGGLQIIHEAMNRGGGEYPDRDILEVLKELGYLSADDEEPDVSGISF